MSSQVFTPKEMLGYRDQIVKSLNDYLGLLAEFKEMGTFDKDEGEITRQTYPEIVGKIQGEIEKLKNFDVVLAVVGTMKAGKSTTINAIVGREILPNRNRPMTALPTLIYHKPNQAEPVLLFNNQAVSSFITHLQTQFRQHPAWEEHSDVSAPEMQELIGKIKTGWQLKQEYHGEQEIFEFLADLNDLVRLSEILRQEVGQEQDDALQFPFEACKELGQLPKIHVAFRHLAEMGENEGNGRLILLDTPGPNEAGQAHLQGMLAEQLARSSAVLLVLDYTQLKSNASADVRAQIDEIPTISKDRMFALVNKFDQKDANSDDEEATKEIVFSDFLRDRIEMKHIFPLAAQQAFLANRMEVELDKHGKPDFDRYGWIADFARLAYGADAEEEWEDADIEAIRKKAGRLITKSKVQAPLQEAIGKTQTEAPRIALQSALSTLQSIFTKIKNTCNSRLSISQKNTEEELQSLEKVLENLKQKLDKLEEFKNEINDSVFNKDKQWRGELDEEREKVKERYQEKIDNIFTKNKEYFEQELRVMESEFKDKRFKLISVGEVNKLKDSIKRLRYFIDSLQGDSFNFHDESEAVEFKNNVMQTCSLMMKEADRYFSEEINNYMEKIKNELGVENKKIQSLFDDITQELSKENVYINLNLDEIDCFFSVNKDLMLNIEIFSKKDPRKVLKPGFFNRMANFFDVFNRGWGKETRNERIWFIKEDEVRKSFLNAMDKYFSGVQNQIDSIFESLKDKWEKEYIDVVYIRADDLLNEIQTAIDENRLNKENLEAYREQIRKLARKNEDVQDDIDSISRKFLVSSNAGYLKV